MDLKTNFDGLGNVGIKDGRIFKITKSNIRGDKIINTSGHVVVPGFIDNRDASISG